jgi:class 3 adenylate cyclase
MAAMILAVSLVSISSYELVRGQVEKHFEDALQQQYATQFQLFQVRKEARLKSVSNEIVTNTSNPRLLAALYEDDYSRFYYDLGQELKPFYSNLEFSYSDTKFWPFFRFIRSDGEYLRPPTVEEVGVSQAVDSLPGVMAPISEDALERLLEPLKTRESDTLDTRSGYLVSESPYAENATILLEAFVCPILDAFGTFLGDLIVVIPWRGEGISQVNALSAIVIKGKVFTSVKDSKDLEEWGGLVRLLDTAGVNLSEQTLLIDNTNYLLFSKRLSLDTHFPLAAQVTLFSLTEQEALKQNISNILILIVAGGLVFSLILSIFVAQGLNAPISRLKAGVLRIGRGDFTTRVEAASRDEIGELSEAFNKMAEDLSLKERYKNVLAQVTDASVADQLIKGQVELGGVNLEVAVLFCDMRNFTEFSTQTEPHELVSVLNEHMTAMTEIAYRFGGIVDKFVGDEIMVLFGAPVSQGDDIKNSFLAAKEMIRRRQAMNANNKTKIDVGIGLAYGTVIAGCMGSNDRLNYTVIGEKVNLASRLCSQAKKMEIAIDNNIRNHLGAELENAEEIEKALKGIDQPTTFYLIKESVSSEA